MRKMRRLLDRGECDLRGRCYLRPNSQGRIVILRLKRLSIVEEELRELTGASTSFDRINDLDSAAASAFAVRFAELVDNTACHGISYFRLQKSSNLRLKNV